MLDYRVSIIVFHAKNLSVRRRCGISFLFKVRLNIYRSVKGETSRASLNTMFVIYARISTLFSYFYFTTFTLAFGVVN